MPAPSPLRRAIGLGLALFPFATVLARAHGAGWHPLTGEISVNARNADVGHRPVYFHGHQRDDSKVWSSAHVIRFKASED